MGICNMSNERALVIVIIMYRTFMIRLSLEEREFNIS